MKPNDKSGSELERGIANECTIHPSVTVNHVRRNGRLMMSPVGGLCLVVAAVLMVQVVRLELRVNRLEEMMALTTPCRGRAMGRPATAAVLAVLPDSADHQHQLEHHSDDVDRDESQLVSEIRDQDQRSDGSLMKSPINVDDDDDDNSDDESDDVLDQNDNTDISEVDADDDTMIAVYDEQLTLKNTDDTRRRVRRSLRDDDDSENSSESEHTDLLDGTLLQLSRRRARRVRRHKVADGTEPRIQQRRAQASNSQKSPKPKHNPAFLMTMNVSASDNQLRRIRAGETINLAHGEFGPFGYRPSTTEASGSGRSYVYRSWTVAEWAKHNQLYSYNQHNGHVTVMKKGVYFVYAQILYHNAAARSSYAIKVNNVDHSHHKLVMCWTSVDVISGTSADNSRFKTCYAGVATTLERNQSVWIEDLYGTYIHTDTHSSYFGLIKLADL